MKVPICGFDAKNAVLCPQCESKIESGELTQADADASIIFCRSCKKQIQRLMNFHYLSAAKIEGNYIIHLGKMIFSQLDRVENYTK